MLDISCKDATRARRSFPLGGGVERESARLRVRKLCAKMATQQPAHATHGFPSCDASEPAPRRALEEDLTGTQSSIMVCREYSIWYLRPGLLLFSLMRTLCLPCGPFLSVISGFIHFSFLFPVFLPLSSCYTPLRFWSDHSRLWPLSNIRRGKKKISTEVCILD